VTIAACCAFDLRSAVIVLSQRLVDDDLVHVVEVKDLTIRKTKDVFFSMSESLEMLAEHLDKRVEQFSKNVIFISDLAFNISPTPSQEISKPPKKTKKSKKKAKDVAPQEPDAELKDPAKIVPLKMKNRHVTNFWTAQDLDLYYGATKYKSSLHSLFPYPLQARSILPRYYGYVY
jgi:hypothetical protein